MYQRLITLNDTALLRLADFYSSSAFKSFLRLLEVLVERWMRGEISGHSLCRKKKFAKKIRKYFDRVFDQFVFAYSHVWGCEINVLKAISILSPVTSRQKQFDSKIHRFCWPWWVSYRDWGLTKKQQNKKILQQPLRTVAKQKRFSSPSIFQCKPHLCGNSCVLSHCITSGRFCQDKQWTKHRQNRIKIWRIAQIM